MAKYAKPVLPIDGNNEAAIDGDWYYMGQEFIAPDGTTNNGDHDQLTSLGYYKWLHPTVDSRYEKAIATYIWTGTGTDQQVTKKVVLLNETEMRTFLYGRAFSIEDYYVNQQKVIGEDWQRCREIYHAWRARNGWGSAIDITGATQANPVVLTVVGHGFTTDDYVYNYDIAGMVEINDKEAQVTVIDADHVSLQGVDGTGFSAYVSGGISRQFEPLLQDELDHFKGETGTLTIQEHFLADIENTMAKDSQFVKEVRSKRTDLLLTIDATAYEDLPLTDYLTMWDSKQDFNDSTQRPPGIGSLEWGQYLNKINYWTE